MENEQSSEKVRAKNHYSYKTFTLLGLLVPFVGIIVGIVYLTKEKALDKKLGEHTIAISILGGVLWFILLFLIGGSEPSVVRTTSVSSPSSLYQAMPEKKSNAKVEVISDKEKKSKYGSSSIIGEVKNTGSEPANFVKITATFYDISNTVVDTAFTYAGDTADVGLQPNKTAPFEVLRMEDIKFDHYKLDVSWNN